MLLRPECRGSLMGKATKNKKDHEEQEVRGNFVTRPFRAFGRHNYNALKASAGVYEHRLLRDITKKSVSRIKNHFVALHQNRSLADEDAPDMSTFSNVMDHWGITRTELNYVKKSIRLQVTIYFILWVASGWGVYLGITGGSVFTLINSCLLFLLSVTVTICRSWRLHVLKQEKFVLFTDWMMGRETDLRGIKEK